MKKELSTINKMIFKKKIRAICLHKVINDFGRFTVVQKFHAAFHHD